MKGIFVLSLLFSLVFSTSPLLFVQKTITTIPPGQNFPMDVRIDLYNSGSTPVTDVTILDAWGPYFEVIDNTTRTEDGLLMAHLDSIAPKTNVSHIYHLKPTVTGKIMPLPVSVRYMQKMPDEKEPTEGEYRTAHAEMLVYRAIPLLSEIEYRRYVTSHMVIVLGTQRCIYTAMVAAAILIPLGAHALLAPKEETKKGRKQK